MKLFDKLSCLPIKKLKFSRFDKNSSDVNKNTRTVFVCHSCYFRREISMEFRNSMECKRTKKALSGPVKGICQECEKGKK